MTINNQATLFYGMDVEVPYERRDEIEDVALGCRCELVHTGNSFTGDMTYAVCPMRPLSKNKLSRRDLKVPKGMHDRIRKFCERMSLPFKAPYWHLDVNTF